MYFVMKDDNVQFITKMCVVIHDDNAHYDDNVQSITKMCVVIHNDNVHYDDNVQFITKICVVIHDDNVPFITKMCVVIHDDNVQFMTKMCVVIQDDNVRYEYIKICGFIMMKCVLSLIMTTYINYNKIYAVTQCYIPLIYLYHEYFFH